MAKKWYVVHTYSGFENKVKKSLEERIRQRGLQDQFGEILIPMEQVVGDGEGGEEDLQAQVLPRLHPRADGDERPRPGTS